MRLKWVIAALGAALLLATGFRPDTLPYTPGAPYSDAVISHLPAAEFLRRSVLENGQFPLWRETILAGQPFAADPLNKTAYPLQWIALLLPPVLHLDLLIVLHLLIAGGGMWVWARSFGLRAEAAALSALAFALSPRALGHLGAGHLDLVYALAWFPWWMWTVGRLVRAQRDAPLQTSLYAALFGGLILLADVRLSLFAYTLGAAYAVYRCAQRREFHPLLRFIVPAALMIALTASVTLPLLAWRPYLSRAALTPADAGVFSLTPGQLIGLLLPPQGGTIETMTAVGLSVLALAILGAVSARQWFWSIAAGAAALYALGSNGFVWSLLVRAIPALLWFRVPSRAWFVVALIAPLLAGYGIDWLLKQRTARRSAIRLTLIGAVIAVVTGAFMLVTIPAINGAAILVGGGGIGVVLLLAFARRLRGDSLAWAVIVVTCLELALIGRGWLEWRAADAWLPPDQAHLAERLVELDAGRIYSPTYSLQQQVAEVYHLRVFGGIDPFQLSGIVAAVEQGGGVEPAGYSVIVPPLDTANPADANRAAVPDTAVLGQWGVTHVVSAYPVEADALELIDVIDGVYLYANHDPAVARPAVIRPALVEPIDWAAGAADLPDAATVASLNQWTLIAAGVSGAALLLTAAPLIVKVRH